MVGLDLPRAVDQVEVEEPEVPLDFGEEVALEDFVERLREQLAALQLEPVLDPLEVERVGLESN